MRVKHASACHELSCAAFVVAVAAAATASGAVSTVTSASVASPAAPISPRAQTWAAFVGASPTSWFLAKGERLTGGEAVTAVHVPQLQTLSMALVATAPRRPSATTKSLTAADALRCRRRRRPTGVGDSETCGFHEANKIWSGLGKGRGVGEARDEEGRGLAREAGISVGMRGVLSESSRAEAPHTVLMGWHPAAEPDDTDLDDSQYDKWRRLRVEELVKDQFLTPGRVNEIMDPSNVQRHQYNTNPDSSFGAVFQLDTLVDVIPGLIYPAWLEVARALNQDAPSLITVQRGYGWTPEQMFIREFNWRLSQEELEGGLEIYERTILRRALKYTPAETPGSRRWLETLRRIPMPMAVLSRLPSSVVDSVLEKTDLAGYFPHRVTGEDERFDDYRGYMLAALKVQRSTMKCCAFDCRQEGMIKAHDADLRGVCRVGIMAAWELRLADYSVEAFDDMTILDFRQLFADRGFEPGMLELELEPEAAPQRKTAVATKVETETRWADEDEEPETLTDYGGGGGRAGGSGGLRRRY